MRNRIRALLVFVLFVLLLAPLSSATTYYVDAVNGQDSYDGTSPVYTGGTTGPKKTIAAGLSLLDQGDDLQIRAGVYVENGLNLNPGVSGTPDNRIVISNYQNEKVYVVGGVIIPDSEWTLYEERGNVDVYKDDKYGTWYHSLYWAPRTGSDSDYGNVRHGYVRNDQSELDEEGEYSREYQPTGGYDHYFATKKGKTPSDYLLIGIHCVDKTNRRFLPIFDFEDEHDYVTIEGLNFVTGSAIIRTTYESDYITLKNITGKPILGRCSREDDPDAGIALKGTHNVVDSSRFSEIAGYFIRMGRYGTIKNSYFDHMVGAAILIGQDMLIDRCEFTKWARKPLYSDLVSGDQNAVGATPNFRWRNVTIQYSYFHDTDDTAETPEWDAEVNGDDLGYAIEIAGKYSDQGDGLVIRYNVFEDVLGAAVSLYGDGGTPTYKNIEIYGNIFSQPEHNGIAETSYSQRAITFNHNHIAPAVFENVKVNNNLFYHYLTYGIGIKDNVELRGNWEIKNNIFLDNGVAMYIQGRRNVSYIDTSNNIFYETGDDNVLSYGNTVYRNLSEWQSEFPGSEANSMQADPMIADPQNSDYTLLPGSPAIDAGTDVGLSLDIEGNAIPLDGDSDGTAVPDIGPIEYTVAPATQCSDGTDNDGDSLIDYPQDPGCSSAQDDSEDTAACGDSVCSSGETCSSCESDCGKCMERIVPYSDNGPVLDGYINETAWQDALAVNFSLPDSDNYVNAFLFYNRNAIYVAFDVEDSETISVRRERDGSTWTDDSVEVFIDAGNDGGASMKSGDYHFIVNANGSFWDAMGNGNTNNYGDSAWNSTGFKTAVQNSPGSYSVEMEIPLKDIGMEHVQGNRAGMLLANNDKDTGSFVYSAHRNVSAWNIPDEWEVFLFAHKADSDRDGCVDSGELTSFIDLWLSGGKVSLKELVGAVKIWMGC